MANRFNPDPFGSTNQPSFLGRSQGSTPVSPREVAADKSGSVNLFAEGLNKLHDVFNLKVQAKDQEFQRRQRREFTEGLDEVNRDFGVNPDTESALGATTGGSGRLPTPREITDGERDLTRLRAANKAGKFRDTHYWARVQTLVRSLRAKYPAYRDQIDQMVARKTGTIPANALRRAILRDNEAANRAAGDGTKIKRRLVEKMLKDGTLPRGWESMSHGDLINHGNQIYTKRANIAQAKSQLDLEAKTIAVNQTKGGIVTSQAMALKTQEIITQNFGTGSEIDKSLEAARAARARGEPIPNNVMNDLQTRFALVKAQTADALQNELFEALRTGRITQDQAQKLRQGALDPILNIESNFFGQNGSISIAQHNKHLIDLMTDSDTANFLRKFPDARLLNTMRKVIPQSALEVYMLKNTAGIVQKINKAASSIVFDQSLKGIPLSRSLDKIKEVTEGDREHGKIIKNNMEGLIKGLLDKGVRDEDKVNLAKSLFSSGNMGFIHKNIDQKDRHKAFITLSNKRVADEMFKLREVSPESWENYKAWTFTTFNRLFRTDFQTLNQATFNRKFWKLSWDAKNAQVRLDSRVAGKDATMLEAFATLANPLTTTTNVVEGILTNQAKEAVERVNTALLAMTPMLKLENRPIEETLNDMLRAGGVTFDESKFKGSDMTNLYFGILEKLKEVADAAFKKDKQEVEE